MLLLCSCDMWAYDFEVDGIYYDIIFGSTTAVTFKDSSYGSYSGDITIPNTVEYDGKTYNVISIGERAFYGSSSLESVVIPQGVTSIEKEAFYNCTGLLSISIPESVSEIGAYAFYWCSSLTGELVIPKGVPEIKEYTFQGCTSLTSVVIPSSVTYINNNAFNQCWSLTSINIPNSVTGIGREAFGYSGLTSVVIPSSVRNMGNSVFIDCFDLRSAVIANGVKNMGQYLFLSCTNLASFVVPNSVTEIEEGLFLDCQAMEFVTIPACVTSLGVYAFRDCVGLTSITSLNPEPPSCSSTFVNVSTDACALCVPEGSRDAYSVDASWGNFWNIQEIDSGDYDIYEELLEAVLTTRNSIEDVWVDAIYDYPDLANDLSENHDDILNEMNDLLWNLEDFYNHGNLSDVMVGEIWSMIEELEAKIKSVLAEIEQAERQAESDSLYETVSGEIAATDELLDETWNTITSDYPDVADDFEDDYAGLLDELKDLVDALDAYYANGDLTSAVAEYMMGMIEEIRARIETLLEAAKTAAGIDGVTTNEGMSAQIYNISGSRVKAMQRGNVYIIRSSDGTTRKVLGR